MCGIAGFIKPGLNSDQGEALARRMLDRLRHRGPDGEGTLFDSGFGLYAGMRRLSIIDLAGGSQPIWNETNTISVLFNGEIYNYIELRNDLVAQGHTFRTQSDTEVIVHLYEQWGTACFTKLRGMFGVALFDLQSRRLVIARDHFGQKPLYFSQSANEFAFASELKALLELPFVDGRICDERLLEYAGWLKLRPGLTHFRGIQKIQAGHFLSLPLDQPSASSTQVAFWRHPGREADPGKTLASAADELDGFLNDSLRIHLRSDVPCGLLLSGGLDSRAIAIYSQVVLHEGLKTFSVGFGNEDSELEAARATAAEIRSTGHIAVDLDADDLASNIARVAWHLDEPIGDPAAFAVLRICEIARQHVKVLLGGEGSDELFAGYATAYMGQRSVLERSQMLRHLLGWTPRSSGSLVRGRLSRALHRAHLSPDQEILELRRTPWLRSDSLLCPLPEKARSQLDDLGREIAPLVAMDSPSLLAKLTGVDTRWHLAESLLQKADKMSMAASIELRCPFLDPLLGEFAASLPDELKLGADGVGKRVLRELINRRFPDAVPRPKLGFPLPLGRWLRGPLRTQVEETMFETNSHLFQVFDRDRLKNLWSQFIGQGISGAAHFFYALWLYCVWRKEIGRNHDRSLATA